MILQVLDRPRSGVTIIRLKAREPDNSDQLLRRSGSWDTRHESELNNKRLTLYRTKTVTIESGFDWT